MYKAILFALDGDFVTDYKADTVEKVWELVENGGSRWFFYPYVAVIRDTGHGASERQRVISAPDGWEALEGRTLATFRNAITVLPGSELVTVEGRTFDPESKQAENELARIESDAIAKQKTSS